MPEDTYAQQRQQICAVLWFVRSMNMERLYMVSELIATDKRAKRLRLVFVHGVPPERLEDARSSNWVKSIAGLLQEPVSHLWQISSA